MRVLLTVPSLDVEKFKGIARLSIELYKGLKKAGIDVEIIEIYKTKNNYLNFLSTLSSIPTQQLLAKVDIIHGIVPEAAAFLGWIKKVKKVKTVASFNDFIILKHAKKLNFRLRSILRYYSLFMWKNAAKSDVVCALSSQTAKEMEIFLKRKADYIINPGIDKRFKPMKVRKGKITLGFFANFSYRKGLDKAVEVYKLVKKKVDVKLIIAGGELKTIYQNQFDIKKLTEGLEDVKILGYVPENKIVKLYNSFDFYLFPSLSEGFGIPILEAQACGIPTLVFSWAEIPAEVKAKTIQCRDTKEMAEKILYLIEHPKEYKKISKEGIKYASRFTWDNFTNNYINVYKGLLDKN
jgi:glycosyltransferase involved in cell wall biosynthesis